MRTRESNGVLRGPGSHPRITRHSDIAVVPMTRAPKLRSDLRPDDHEFHDMSGCPLGVFRDEHSRSEPVHPLKFKQR